MADGMEGSGARLVDVSVPAQRQRMALLLNGVLGLAFLGATAVGLGLAYSSKLSSGGAASVQDDALTVAMVAVVAVVWGGLLAGSVRWERGLAQPRTLAVPIRALVDRGGRPQLAASEAEAVCDQLSDEADLEPPWWMATGAGLLISIGLAGTFLGLSLGLLQTVPLLVGAQASTGSDAADVTAALMPLLEGAKLAFVKSLAGVVLGTLWTLRMAELRHFAAGARAHLRARLLDSFPPVTPEVLLSELLASRDEDRRVQAEALKAAAAQVTTTLTEAIKAQADAAEAGAQQRSEALARARSEAQTALLAALAPLPPLNTAAAQMAEDLRELRGGDEASVHALVGKLDALKTAVDDAAEALPGLIGTATGSSVSTGMKASFTDIANALTSLSSQGGEAVSDVLKESVGQQTSALSEALAALTASLSGLPQGVAASGTAAQQVLATASTDSATKLTEAAAAIQATANLNAAELREAVAALHGLIGKLATGGDELHRAFAGVAAPLQALPAQLGGVSRGVETAVEAAKESAVAIRAAGLELDRSVGGAAKELREAADAAAAELRAGGASAQASLTEGGAAARSAMEAGSAGLRDTLVDPRDGIGPQLKVGFTEAGEALDTKVREAADRFIAATDNLEDNLQALHRKLRASVVDEIGVLRTAMGQRGAEMRALLDETAAERALSQQAAVSSREALEALQANSRSLLAVVAGLAQQVERLQGEVMDTATALRVEAGEAGRLLRSAGAHTSEALRLSGDVVAGRLGEVAQETGRVRDAVAAAGAVAAALQSSGEGLQRAFGAVTEPLADLPRQLATTKDGLEAARDGLGQVGAQLSAASQTFGEGATQAAKALADGGAGLAAGLAAARRELGEGFTTELVAIQGALGAQLTAQEGMLAGTKEQHELMARSADMARQRLESLNDKSTALVEGIETLRQTCADTVAALQAAAGDQRSGADQAVQDLLTAVAKFSESLDKSQGAVQDASLRAVASTEQVTTEAARRVADALAEGADRFEQSMGRVEQVGQRLDAHGQALEKNLSAAQVSAAALTGHGEALVRSAGALKAELAGVVSPLSDARLSLMTVPGAVNAAVTTLTTEHKALSGLSTSLKDQAELVRTQERELAKRTADLRQVTDALGGQIAAHVDRLTKAQEKVAVAWAEAVGAGDERHEERVKAVASYADRVEQALGLGSSVKGLTEALRDVADSLADMRKLPAEVASLHASITKLEAALDGGAG